MSSRSRKLVSALFLAAVAGTVEGAPEVPEALQLPFHQTLATESVRIAVDAATLVIHADDSAVPSVNIRAIEPEKMPSIELDVNRGASGLEISESDPAADLREIVIELTIRPETPILVEGKALRIERIFEEDPGDPTTAIEDRPTENTGPQSVFRLEEGSLEFLGPGSARFETNGSMLTVSSTSGSLVFETTGGSIAVDGHVGTIHVESNDSPVSIENARGDVTATVSRGRLTAAGISGALTLEADQASLDLTDIGGNLEILGNGNVVSVREGRLEHFRLEGTNLSARIDDCSGIGVIRMTRGTLEADRWEGRLSLNEVTAADVELSRLDADLVIGLNDGTSCTVRGVTGHIRGTINNAALDLSGIKSIELAAASSNVTISEIREMTSIDLTNSDLEFSSQNLKGEPHFKLSGSSQARIEVPEPCKVQLTGPGKDGSNVDVRGCALHRGSLGAVQRRKKRWETHRPLILDIIMGPDAFLQVESLNKLE